MIAARFFPYSTIGVRLSFRPSKRYSCYGFL
jgi:hypothetical protein